MSGSAPLHGSCSCGRNEYTVYIPEDQATTSLAQVFFDSGSANRRHQAAPLTAWLRVPLPWYQSATYAYYPDETHASIRRTFTSPASTHPALPTVRRQFCGYCGTQLSSWNERTRDDADFISLTLGSLVGEDLDRLVGLGLLPDEEREEGEEQEEEVEETRTEGVEQADASSAKRRREGTREVVRTQSQDQPTMRGFPWFESVVENSRLGRIKRQKGGHTSRDGTTRVEWEVVEVDGEGGEETEVEQRGTKRKGEADADTGAQDVQMGSS
ncbi:MAG: hypothetical protein Q9165_005852 [Trypethelium subeluteriae]